MNELGFIHQHCVFNLLQRIWDNIFININYELQDCTVKLKNSKEKLSNSEIKKMVTARKKELKK